MEKDINDLEIGETFFIKNRKFKIVNSDNCRKCCFKDVGCGSLLEYNLIPECSLAKRRDTKNVIFKEVNEED